MSDFLIPSSDPDKLFAFPGDQFDVVYGFCEMLFQFQDIFLSKQSGFPE